jgi:hypothetical protein
MRSCSVLALSIAVSALVAQSWPAQAADWKPVEGHIMTRWTAKVDPRHTLPEHPRPQMVRKEWVNLNGLWDYAIVDAGSAQPETFEGKILVPFPVESALSGVKRPLTDKQELWYRRTFKTPSVSEGKRLLLHFGAVDWHAVVFVNGQQVGEHKGGYGAFTFDITEQVKPGDNAELVVKVWDPTGANGGAKGKQNFNSIANPSGIMYTPCSGIWQTVWLETVPTAHLASLRITTDVDNGTVTVVGVPASAGPEPPEGGTPTMSIEVLDGGRVVASGTGMPATLKIPNAKLWSPDAPFLYDLKATYGKDVVASYFGMRRISLGKDAKGVPRILLNNESVFQAGPLDQGFWPDGIYTAPTDEALRYDIEATKQLGFNMARKHVKVEPDRWYYWCDKLGLLVWQDMPSAGGGKGGDKETDGVPADADRATQFEAELKEMVGQLINHPSIVMWVVFNEGWGQYDTARISAWVKGLDPTRLVNNASGWNDRGAGDVNDVHRYPGPGCPEIEATRAAVLGEFGGLGLAVPGHTWVEKSWGYRQVADTRALTRRYLDLWREVWRLNVETGLCAAVYTQTTDVETECNGLMTYDREVIKVDVPQVAGTYRGEFPPPPKLTIVVPTAEQQPAEWRYTTEKPPDNWMRKDFDDSVWAAGLSGFGTRQTPGAVIGTEWKTPEIWLRRVIEIPKRAWKNPMLVLHHDEDAEVFLDGAPVVQVTGYTTRYEDFAPAPGARIEAGRAVLAVHCKQTGGGQYIDCGLGDLE